MGDMEAGDTHITDEKLVTPRAAAIAGILFSILFVTSYGLIIDAIPAIGADSGAWLTSSTDTLGLAVSLVPFSGIAFIWFMAVVRDRLGHLEDQFFSTLFFGSGLLYLGMIFVASGLFGGLILIGSKRPELLIDTSLYATIRAMIYQIIHEYAIRMAGMFMIVLGTIWFRTLIMPRWLVLITYLFALILLFSMGYSDWMMMIFPAWVFLVSVYILVLNFRKVDQPDTGPDGMTLDD
jgi:hypothetical protein